MNRCARRQDGLSLVEALVGLALGLLVVAVGLATKVAHLHDTRRVAQGLGQMQAMRATLDLLSRDLRRAGHWQDALAGVAAAAPAGPVPSNPYALDTAPPPGMLVGYGHAVPEGRSADRFGWRLRRATVEFQLGTNQWHAVTDPDILEVTRLEVVPAAHEVSLAAYCLAPCPAESADCPPRQRVVSYRIELRGQVPGVPASARDLGTTLTVRNDTVVGACGP